MSTWVWARKPDRSSAGRKGSTGVDDGEERQMRRAVAGEEGYCSGVGFGVGEGEEAGSIVRGEEGEHRRRRWRPGREADATGKKGKGEQAVGGGEEWHAVAGEEGEAAASESVMARVRKPDRTSARRTGGGERGRRGEGRGERGENEREKEKKRRRGGEIPKNRDGNGFPSLFRDRKKIQIETEKKNPSLFRNGK